MGGQLAAFCRETSSRLKGVVVGEGRKWRFQAAQSVDLQFN